MTTVQIQAIKDYLAEVADDENISVNLEDGLYHSGRVDGVLDFLMLLEVTKVITTEQYKLIHPYSTTNEQDNGIL